MANYKKGTDRFKGTTNNGTTNITEYYDSDNTLREFLNTNGFKQIRWRDEYAASDYVPASGTAAPDLNNYTIGGVGTRMYGFDGGGTEERLSNTFEIPHDLEFEQLNAETIFMEAHVHWMPSTTNTGTVKWFFDYCYIPVNGAPIAQATLSIIETISASNQYYHKISPFESGGVVKIPKPSSGFTLGDIILFNIRRTPTGDTYPDDALFIKCALHVPTNDFGSRQMYIK